MKDRQSALDRLAELFERVRSGQPSASRADPNVGVAPTPEATHLIVGLGNPGRDYAHHRHNIGFLLIDRLAAQLGTEFRRLQAKAFVTDARHADKRLILAKPQTYMNESGQVVSTLLKFYKVPIENLIVIYDDMDLPFGALRIRPKGGSSGQKGMRSIIERLGGLENFPRLRLGIGRPPGRMAAEDFLLQDFSSSERADLEPVLENGIQALLILITEGLETAMNRYNSSPSAG